MTPERFINYVLGIIVIVLAVVLLVWLVDRLDDDADLDGAAIPAWELLD